MTYPTTQQLYEQLPENRVERGLAPAFITNNGQDIPLKEELKSIFTPRCVRMARMVRLDKVKERILEHIRQRQQ